MKNTFYILLFTFLATSCSITKYLPEGELLYVGGKVKVENDSISKKERKNLQGNLQKLIRPISNKKMLSLMLKILLATILTQLVFGDQ